MLINQLHTYGAGIRALYDYDNTIFDDMQVPEDFTKEEIMNRIFFKYGDTPLYMFNPEIMKFYIKEWSARLLPLWERYAAAVALEYDPIENYNRTEQRVLTHGKKITYSGSITDTPSGTITDNIDTEEKNELSADNSSTFVNDNKSTLSGKSNERTYTNYKEERSFNNSDTNSGRDIEDLHIYGNIGTMTSQSMLTSELDLIPRLDTLDFIVDSFKTEFCLYVY